VLIVAVLVACVVLGAGIGARYAFVTSADDAAVKQAPRIADTAFEQQASSVCKRYKGTFDTATTLSKVPSQLEAGDFLDQIATTFDRMVAELKLVAVAAPDRSVVERWLADWDAYDAYGHQYATAVRNGAERDLVNRDSSRIGALRRQRNGFARANHLSACAFN